VLRIFNAMAIPGQSHISRASHVILRPYCFAKMTADADVSEEYMGMGSTYMGVGEGAVVDDLSHSADGG
jgi:hypothetical protein